MLDDHIEKQFYSISHNILKDFFYKKFFLTDKIMLAILGGDFTGMSRHFLIGKGNTFTF